MIILSIFFYSATRATELYFGTLSIGESRQITFRLANLSESHTLKFQWPTVPALTFVPSTGHIRPKCSKTIAVNFKTQKPQMYKALKVVGRLWKITFSKPLSQVPDWDDRMKSVQWVPVTQPIPPPTPPTAATTVLENSSINSISSTTSKFHIGPLKKKVVETEREPVHQVIEETHTDLELSITAIADFCKYECPITEIKFRETMMYQTRAYKFPLRNSGKIQLQYQWSILNYDQTTPETEGEVKPPFFVSPVSGCIASEDEVEITVRFSPLQALEAHYLLSCQ